MPDKSDKSCTICGGKTIHLFSTKDLAPLKGDGESFDILKCTRCHVAVTDPLPGEASIGDYYPAQYYGEGSKKFSSLFEILIKLFRGGRAKKVTSLKSKGWVLDMGCGRGWMLKMLKDRGFDVIGTELSDDSARFARESLGLDIKVGKLEDVDLEKGSIDIITMWHSFEHVYNPKGVLPRAGELLKDDGSLLISVPNFASLQSQIGKGLWFHLDSPRHLYHFTPSSLERMLDECGFKVTEKWYSSLEYNFFGMVQTLYNVMGLKPNLLYDIIRSGSAKLSGSSFASTIVGIILMTLLSTLVFPASFILTIATDCTALGGTINFVAKKTKS